MLRYVLGSNGSNSNARYYSLSVRLVTAIVICVYYLFNL